jgi:D-proline reductase (dithiol) PrdB
VGQRVRAVAALGGDRLLGGPCRTRRKPISRPRSDYRAIPATIAANDLLCSHISISFDRTGFQEDWNVVFPLDRLNELAAGGMIGSVADKHYSFMGATDPVHMEPYARELAGRLSRMPSTPPFFAPLDRFARAP